jgi:nucleoside-diphosphate-sugar epimerase
MLDTHTALAAAARPPPRTGSAPRRVLVAGGGGTLGSAVLERLLAEHRFARVGVLAEATLNPALRRLQPVADDPAAFAAFAPDTALVVYDRERLANGREAALLRPQPADLLALATRLRAAGVQTLVVVVPHSAALLPAALSQGLASLDEGAVAALGFARLVFMRTAQAGGEGSRPARWPERLAAWMLSQLHWMVPARQQPVRAATVARVAVDLALQLPAAEPGTRVLAPEWLWHAAQTGDARSLAALLGAWLSGQAPPVAQGGPRQHW